MKKDVMLGKVNLRKTKQLSSKKFEIEVNVGKLLRVSPALGQNSRE